MPKLWLSVQDLLMKRTGIPFPDVLFERIVGIHVDATACMTETDIESMIEFVHRNWLGLPYDLHFLDSHPEAMGLISSARAANIKLNRIFSPDQIDCEHWAPAASASGVARGEADDFIRNSPKILVTAPSAKLSRFVRASAINTALSRVRVVGEGRCSVVLDRDLDSRLGALVTRDLVEEIVVGKAIVRAADPVSAVLNIEESWGNHDE